VEMSWIGRNRLVRLLIVGLELKYGNFSSFGGRSIVDLKNIQVPPEIVSSSLSVEVHTREDL
jgi:hypothetical protein